MFCRWTVAIATGLFCIYILPAGAAAPLYQWKTKEYFHLPQEN
jgi:hypothetical protein